jgi:hypothetical protein
VGIGTEKMLNIRTDANKEKKMFNSVLKDAVFICVVFGLIEEKGGSIS